MPAPNGNFKVYDVTLSPYSADNTGSTDATSAIQTAVDDCVANGGGIVYAPAGIYRLDGQFTSYNPSGDIWNGVAMKVGVFFDEVAGTGTTPVAGHVIFCGDGPSTRFRLNSDNMFGFQVSGSFVRLRDFTIDGQTTMNTSSQDWTKNRIGVSISPYDIDSNPKFDIGTITGTFSVGETVNQSGSGASGALVSVRDTIEMYWDNTTLSGTPNGTGLLTGATSGATVTPTAYTAIRRFRLSKNHFEEITVHNCRVGLHLEAGGLGSTDIYRNHFRDFIIHECGIGIWLESNGTTGVTPPSVNRNFFSGIDINWAHIGYYHQSGDTNTFVHFEINNNQIPWASSPISDNVASAIYMLSNDEFNSWGCFDNQFFGLPFEGNNRNMMTSGNVNLNAFYGYFTDNDTGSGFPTDNDVWPNNKDTWNLIIGRGGFVIPSREAFYRNSDNWTPANLPAGNLTADFNTDELYIKLDDGTWGGLTAGSAGQSADVQHTTTSRDALSPSAGWRVWNTTTGQAEQYNGSAWVEALNKDGKFRTT